MSDIKIFQIYYAQEQLGSLDSAFIPYDNSKPARNGEFETGVLRDHFRCQGHLTADFTGFVSWKFSEKAQIPGNVFFNFIHSSPGYDVYFLNPYPRQVRWKNVWFQGNHFHAHVMEFTQSLLDKLDYGFQLKEIINGVDTLAYCNYWVANALFWENYMKFLDPLYDYIQNELTAEERGFIERKAHRDKDFNYFPYIFERMFSTYLVVAAPPVNYLSLNKVLYDKGIPMFWDE